MKPDDTTTQPQDASAPTKQDIPVEGLLPCPCCGGLAAAEPIEPCAGLKLWLVICSRCYLQANTYPEKTAAITAWNTRHAFSPAAVEVERLQGQEEGFAAAVAWLRERSAIRPPATLWHAAAILADQLEQTRQPARAALTPTNHEARS